MIKWSTAKFILKLDLFLYIENKVSYHLILMPDVMCVVNVYLCLAFKINDCIPVIVIKCNPFVLFYSEYSDNLTSIVLPLDIHNTVLVVAKFLWRWLRYVFTLLPGCPKSLLRRHNFSPPYLRENYPTETILLVYLKYPGWCQKMTFSINVMTEINELLVSKWPYLKLRVHN